MQVLPLAVASPALLEQVFAKELEDWRAQLSWNYSSAVALIKRHISCRSLPGFFLVDGSAAAGYCYYVVAPPLGYLGNVYVVGEHASQSTYELLITSAMRALQAHPEVRRIESQVFGFNCDVSPIMIREQFAALRRYFMARPLVDPDPVQDDALTCPRGFRILAWDRGYFLPAADTIYDSYSGSPDHDMCYDYQSREGCVRFLRNLVDNPGCGRFCPETSRIAIDGAGRVVGVLITSLISPGTGMIPQISIRTSAQGQGLGSALLARYFKAATDQGLGQVTLSVSAQNARAHQLYSRLGFRETKEFYAFIWTSK